MRDSECARFVSENIKLTHARIVLGCALALFCLSAQADTSAILQAQRGRVVYVDFWASWCVPCRESFPWMKALERTYASRGLTVLAIDVDQNQTDAQRFLRVFRPNFQVLFDPNGKFAQKYGIIGMPTSFLIDRTGKVRFTHVGFFLNQRGQYEQEVRELLAQK